MIYLFILPSCPNLCPYPNLALVSVCVATAGTTRCGQGRGQATVLPGKLYLLTYTYHTLHDITSRYLSVSSVE